MAETKIKVDKKVLADGSRICRVEKYARTEVLPEGKRKHVIAALHECQIDPHITEYTTAFYDMTGKYEGDKSVVCINQAGSYVVVWFSLLYDGTHRGANRTLYKYEGEFDAEAGFFRISGFGGTEGTGEMVVDTGSSLNFEFDDGTTYSVIRYIEGATMSDRAVAALRAAVAPLSIDAVEGALENEQMPIGRSRMLDIGLLLHPSRIRAPLQRVFEIEPMESTRGEIYRALEMLQKWFAKPDLEPRRMGKGDDSLWFERAFANADKNKVKAYCRRILHARHISLLSHSGVERNASLYEWFQRLRTWNSQYSLAPLKIPFSWLDIEEPKSFRYTLELDATSATAGVGLPLGSKAKKRVKESLSKMKKGVFKELFDKALEESDIFEKIDLTAGGKALVGTITITNEFAPQWSETFPFIIAYASGGRGGGGFDYGIDLRAKGWCEAKTEWVSSDFPGSITTFAGVAATWDGERADGQFVWNASGSGANRGVQMIFDEVETELSPDDLGLGWGVIFEEDSVNSTDSPSKYKTVPYRADTSGEETFDFELGSATVREVGRTRLRRFAAHELRALRDSASSLTVTGFADRLDRKWFNQQLSEARAKNAVVALRDCTGDAIEADVKTFGAGEGALAFLDQFLDFPDGQSRPEWRRVVVVLNYTAHVELRVRDLMVKGG